MNEKKNRIKTNILTILFAICYILFGWTIVIPLLATRILCDTFYRVRITPTIKIINENYYEGLKKKPVSFKSGLYTLRGGLFYYNQDKPYKGLVVILHGIGCGMYNYINIANYFAKRGYLAFVYDMTGVCSSDGPGMIGLQRSAQDAANAIKYVQTLEETKGLNTYIFGHSMGGYAAAACLNILNPESITAVASLSGFNKYWDVMDQQGEKMIGPMFGLSKIFADLYFAIRLGKAYKYEAIEGMNKFNKPVIIMHSKDDITVPFRLGIISYKDTCTNKSVKYIEFEDRGHTIYRPIESEKRIDESLIGKPTLKKDRRNTFQYHTDRRYCYSELEDVFGVDEDILDYVEEFFDKAGNKEEKC